MPMRSLEREVSIKTNMMLFVCIAATMAGNAFASSQLFAATFSVPTMPEAEWDDTEVVTNAVLPAVRADSRVFAFSLDLDATASNNVEVAFGQDTDHNGVLSRGEADLLVGWDCGTWKVVDCATGDETIEQGTDGRVSLDWRLEFNAANVPRSLSATANGRAAFAALAAHPPRFLYSPEWDTVRVACRGIDSPNPVIAGSIENFPLSIRIR